jgi:Carboxypeptidase regulatory-like domain/TonB-dependent Receptor Plug Domain
MKRLHRAVELLLIISLTTTILAQEFRATLNGKVTDPSKAVVPGAAVKVVNLQTNETTTVTTNSEGNYTVSFLNPGLYSITVEATGFKKHTRASQELQVNQTATINFELELGAASETVTISAENPLLEDGNADRGSVIDNSILSELPLNSRNPFMLAALVPGVTFDGDVQNQRPFDNNGVSSWSINGGRTNNSEFLLDGAPNNAISGGNNNIGLVPSADAVQEFKIITNAYDAQYGRTAGGIINVSLKSGGNKLHGSVFEYARRNFLDANSLVANTRGIPAGKFLNPDGSFSDAGHILDQYGGQINGPVWIPKLYDGRNKTFFLFSFEGYRERTPNPAVRTVPMEEFLRGDFRNLKNAQGQQIVIYDPATGREVPDPKDPSKKIWVRDQFQCNGVLNVICPDRISPLARKLIPYFPKPNIVTPGSDPWRNNYSDIPNMASDAFRNWAAKVDQSIGPKDKMFFRFAYNTRTEMSRANGILEGPAQQGQLPLIRANHNGVLDWVHTFNSALVLNVRASANRFYEIEKTDAGIGFDATELGFPQSLVDQLPMKLFPRIDLNDYIRLGRGSLDIEPTNVFTFQPNVLWMRGAHTIRSGLDLRFSQYSRLSSGDAGMRISFSRNFTRRVFNDNNDPLSGNSIASMLLGAVASGGVDFNAATIFMWKYYAPWVQDDWKVNNRLTLNLGFRLDFNTPIEERFNRQNYALDPVSLNPVSQRIDRKRFPQIPEIHGGLRFLSMFGNPDNPWRLDKNNLQPRIGAAFKLDEKTVLRGGFGRFYLNPTATGHTQGFGIRTSLVASNDGNRTPVSDFSGLFPNGITRPSGSSLGLETFLGRDISFANPNFEIPYVHSFSFGVQRQLGWRTVMEVSYVGTRSYRLQSSNTTFNEMSLDFRKQCDLTQGGNRNFCDENLTNPFRNVPGFEGSGFFTGSTRTRYQLSRPYPQFGSVTETMRNDGKSWYNSLQVVLNRRFKGNLILNGTYTFSKTMEVQPADVSSNVYRITTRGIAAGDRPHRVTIAGVYYLPIGKGKRFFNSMPGIFEGVFGGWEVAGAFIRESGRPWDFPNPDDDPALIYLGGGEVSKSESRRFINGTEFVQGVKPCVERLNTNTASPNFGKYELLSYSVAYGCASANFRYLEPYQTQTTALRDTRLRRQIYQQFDVNIAKNWRVGENKEVQFRLEGFNLFNTPIYHSRQYNRDANSSEFGTINKRTTNQSNYARQFQLAMKFNF